MASRIPIACLTTMLIVLVAANTVLSEQYSFGVLVREGEFVNNSVIVDLDADDPPPQINNRGDIAFLAVASSGEAIFVRDAQGNDRRVFGIGDRLSRPSDNRSILIDDFDEDDFTFDITNSGVVFSNDFDDLRYFAVERDLVAFGNDSVDDKPVELMGGHFSDSDKAYLVLHDPNHSDLRQRSIYAKPEFLVSYGDIVDAGRIGRFYTAWSSSGRFAFAADYDPEALRDFGSHGVFLDDELISSAERIGAFDGFWDTVLAGVNDSGQVLFGKLDVKDNVLNSTYYVDDKMKLSSNELIDDRGEPVHAIAPGGFTSDGNMLSKVVFRGANGEAGTEALYFNDQQIVAIGSLLIDGSTLSGVTKWSANDRGDIVFIGKFNDGMDRIVVAQRQIVHFPGDFDNDNVLDASDIAALTDAIRNAPSVDPYDLNGDNVVNKGDLEFWVHDLKKTYFGDANLDGRFDSTDLVTVFVQNEYEDTEQHNSSWIEGDWNGDGDFTSADLILAFQDGGYEEGQRQMASAVPEPASSLMLLLYVTVLSHCIRLSRSVTVHGSD